MVRQKCSGIRRSYLAKAKKSAQKILEKKSVSADTASAGCAYFRPMDSHPLRDGENELAALQQSK